MNDIQGQKPYTVDQISNDKPNAPRTMSVLSGYIGNSMNGGHNKVIAFKQVMAGEKHLAYRLKANFQMLTPLTPTYQNLKMTIRTYFVPNSRVWTNAEKFTAQKGGSAEIKITEIPNLGGKIIPQNIETPNGEYVSMSDTQIWRDSFISSYLPRMGWGNTQNSVDNARGTLPKVSVLPLRGRVAIYNDMERHKEYDAERQEYKGDTVSDTEWKSYLPTNLYDSQYYMMRAKRENSYYTDYRTELQGFEENLPTVNEENSFITWAAWESKMAEARSQAENAQANDWDIISKIRGSRILTEGKVQKIGQKTFRLNYAAITQNTYNNNENIDEQFRVMGKQGAYSYTEVDIPLYEGVEFVEEGYIHVIATVSADSVYEGAFDRLEMNVGALDQYRPDMETDKQDVLYTLELGSQSGNMEQSQVLGFKRKFSEFFKLPNIIGGDMCSAPWYQNIIEDTMKEIQVDTVESMPLLTNSTFQFFEQSNIAYIDDNDQIWWKDIWHDYTDILINKNQAIKNKLYKGGVAAGWGSTEIAGQNQIFFVGVCSCIAELPINSEITKNYTTWGEH